MLRIQECKLSEKLDNVHVTELILHLKRATFYQMVAMATVDQNYLSSMQLNKLMICSMTKFYHIILKFIKAKETIFVSVKDN